MPLTGRSLQVALDDPADGCCAEASAWALHEGVRLPPWSAVSWQVDWRDATSPADARPFRGRRWWLLGNGGESREALFLFFFLVYVQSKAVQFPEQIQCDIPKPAERGQRRVLSRRSGDATVVLRWSCPQLEAGPSDCWEDGRRRRGGKKKRRVWENNSLAGPGAGNVTPRFAVEAACHNEEIVQSRGIGHLNAPIFGASAPLDGHQQRKRGVCMQLAVHEGISRGNAFEDGRGLQVVQVSAPPEKWW